MEKEKIEPKLLLSILRLDEKTLLIKVLKQDERLRGRRRMYRNKNGFELGSIGHPQINQYSTGIFYIRGKDRDKDNDYSFCIFDSKSDCDRYYKNLLETINYVNNKLEL